MKSEILEINISQTSKTLAILAAVVSALITVTGLISLAVGLETEIAFQFFISITVTSVASKALLLLFMPVLCFVVTYVSVAVFCIIYNMVAKHTGGITFLTKSH
jgi:hypothetical protein